jgi:hypothetical protein
MADRVTDTAAVELCPDRLVLGVPPDAPERGTRPISIPRPFHPRSTNSAERDPSSASMCKHAPPLSRMSRTDRGGWPWSKALLVNASVTITASSLTGPGRADQQFSHQLLHRDQIVHVPSARARFTRRPGEGPRQRDHPGVRWPNRGMGQRDGISQRRVLLFGPPGGAIKIRLSRAASRHCSLGVERGEGVQTARAGCSAG